MKLLLRCQSCRWEDGAAYVAVLRPAGGTKSDPDVEVHLDAPIVPGELYEVFFKGIWPSSSLPMHGPGNVQSMRIGDEVAVGVESEEEMKLLRERENKR